MSPARPKSPFEFTGGNPCLDFANTVDDRTTDHPRDLLTDYARLLQWGEGAGVITAKTTRRLRHLASKAPGKTLTTLRASIQLRNAIYDIFSAVAQRRAMSDTALAILNRAVRQTAKHAQILHPNRRFTWEWIEPENNVDSMLWPVSRAVAELLIGEEIGYVRQCASETCSWLFLDKTKNHRRRWCAMKSCGNRDKARRYYQRQKAG
jgi:predicted RNA-binding Zn ribbon-like protein